MSDLTELLVVSGSVLVFVVLSAVSTFFERLGNFEQDCDPSNRRWPYRRKEWFWHWRGWSYILVRERREDDYRCWVETQERLTRRRTAREERRP
jgi:hypothetical protein